MQIGSEGWKWGLVIVLLAVFIFVANQAYQQIASQEDFAPPDDYLKGDSWDIEHGLATDPAMSNSHMQGLSGSDNLIAGPTEQALKTTPTAGAETVGTETNAALGADAALGTEAAGTETDAEAADAEAAGDAIDWGDIKSPKKE